MNKGNLKFLTKLHALDKRVKSMEKIERNLSVMNQSVQSLFRTMEKEDQSRASMIIETPPVPRLEGNRTE